MKKKILVICAVLAMTVSSLSGCGSSSKAVDIPKIEDTDKTKVDSKKKFDFKDGYATIAANGNYELSMDKDYQVVNLKQVDTGEVWSTRIEGARTDADKSLFKFSYYNSSAKEASPAQYFSSKMKAKSAVAIIGKDEKGNESIIGARVEYNASKLKIDITMDIYLTEDGMEYALQMGSINETGDYKVIAVDMLQNLSAATNTQDGYYFYPDGCGAIMEFKDASHQNESSVEYKIYGDVEKYKNMLGEWDENGEDVYMPIFGANIANKSFLGIIKEGEETASVNILPKSGDDGVNKMWCTFTYRNLFNDVRTDSNGQEVVKNRYDSELADVKRVVSYSFFKAGEETSYADMAVKYREYLMNDCGLKVKNDTTIPVSLDIFMGINEEGTVRDSFKTVTNFEQAEKMVNELTKKGVEGLEVQLKGWTKNGYFTDPVQFPVNSKIGGNSGLKEFTENYKSNKDVKITLETNLLEAKAEGDGYDSNSEIVVAGNFDTLSDPETKRYLLTPNFAAGTLNQLIEDAEDADARIDGLSFYSLGQYVTYNYSKENTLNKSQCKMIWEDILKKAQDTYGKNGVIVQGGNQYALKYADKVTSIPYSDSGYRITTSSVPVFQIAVHGLVDYTGDALNLSSDKESEILKWVEYGYLPYFELTYKGSEELMHTDYSELFSSTFSSWVDEVAEISKDFNADLADLQNMLIIDHEEVEDGVYKITYQKADDKKSIKHVYVNYNDVECEVDGNVIDANDYFVK